MSCPRDNLIVRLLAGELSPDEERDFRRHLEGCPACRSAHSRMLETWDLLDDWEIAIPKTDLTARVLDRAAEEASDTPDDRERSVFWPGMFRIAASILVATGLGMGAGQLVSRGASSQTARTTVSISAEDVVESLGLTDFAIESATGLPLGFDLGALSEGGTES